MLEGAMVNRIQAGSVRYYSPAQGNRKLYKKRLYLGPRNTPPRRIK